MGSRFLKDVKKKKGKELKEDEGGGISKETGMDGNTEGIGSHQMHVLCVQ